LPISAIPELIGLVEAQLRELGYAVRPGQLREPSIAPCTESGAQGKAAGATSLFRPGELGRMVEAVTAKAHLEGRPQPEQERPAAERQATSAEVRESVLESRPESTPESRPENRPESRSESERVRAILEWPWEQRTELTANLNIGRDYAF